MQRRCAYSACLCRYTRGFGFEQFVILRECKTFYIVFEQVCVCLSALRSLWAAWPHYKAFSLSTWVSPDPSVFGTTSPGRTPAALAWAPQPGTLHAGPGTHPCPHHLHPLSHGQAEKEQLANGPVPGLPPPINRNLPLSAQRAAVFMLLSSRQ